MPQNLLLPQESPKNRGNYVAWHLSRLLYIKNTSARQQSSWPQKLWLWNQAAPKEWLLD